MAYATKGSPPSTSTRVSLLASLKLARWEARRTLWLLSIAGLGILLAVVIICALPLYAQIAVSAGIREAINNADGGSYITVSAVSYQPDGKTLSQVQQQMTRQVQNALGSFAGDTPQLSIHYTDMPVISSPRFYPDSQLDIVGVTPREVAPHLTLLQGRRPGTTSSLNDIEIALTPATAKALNATTGSTLSAQVFTSTGEQTYAGAPVPTGPLNIRMHVVGIFQLPARADPYWHQEDFHIAEVTNCKTCPPGVVPPLFQVMASNQTLINTFGGIPTSYVDYGGYVGPEPISYISPPLLYWYYHLDASKLTITNFSSFVDKLKTAINNLGSGLAVAPYVIQTQGSGPFAPLQTYRNYVNDLLIPATGLTALLLGLVLYFVGVMMNLLIERRAASIATLRSRGANRKQVMGLFSSQAIALGLAALIAGPLLAILAVYLLARTTLPPAEQDALNLLTAQPGAIAAQLLLFALIAVIIALLAMLLALYQATGVNVLMLRRASSRANRVPFWQRARLDLLVGALALGGYIAVIYIASPGVLGARTRVVALAPLTLIGTACLVVAALLFFLRGFPLIPDLLSRIAFIIFALVFSASQAQRVRDAAAYEVGSDFRGDISYLAGNVPSSTFTRLPGVVAAATGYVGTKNVAGLNDVPVTLLAVDARTFAQATSPATYDPSTMAALTARLVAMRNTPRQAVPAIIDQAAASNLHLAAGSRFAISDVNGSLNIIVIGVVLTIPTVIDTTTANDTGEALATGGLLVDFQTFNTAEAQVNNAGYTDTTVWVKAQDTPQARVLVRRELELGASSVTVYNLNDSVAMAGAQQRDPLYIALLEILISGALAALLLALVGTLVASWQSARARLTSFAVLRALGGARADRQRAAVGAGNHVHGGSRAGNVVRRPALAAGLAGANLHERRRRRDHRDGRVLRVAKHASHQNYHPHHLMARPGYSLYNLYDSDLANGTHRLAPIDEPGAALERRLSKQGDGNVRKGVMAT